MTDGLYVDERSLRALNINIKAFKDAVLRSATTGLKEFGMKIVRQAQMNLKNNGSIAFDHLRGSGRTIAQADGTVDAGFYIGYAEYVEYGRPRGKMPPLDSIYAWVHKKKLKLTKKEAEDTHLTEREKKTVESIKPLVKKGRKKSKLTKAEREERTLAYLIAKSIADHGSKPHPFLKPAYEQYRNSIDLFMQGVINKTIEQFRPSK